MIPLRGRGGLRRKPQVTTGSDTRPGAPGDLAVSRSDVGSLDGDGLPGDLSVSRGGEGSPPRGGGSPGEGDRTGRPERPRPGRSPRLRLAALLCVIGLAIVVGVAVLRSSQDPTVGELRSRAGWGDLRALRVGISGDVPSISEWHEDGRYTGFDVDVAYLVADWLGVLRRNVSFYEVTPENRHRMVGVEHGKSSFVPLDLVVAAYSMTPDRQRKEHVAFAGPYLRTETTVLTRIRPGGPLIESLSALGQPSNDGRHAQRVCVPGTSTSAQYLKREAPGAQVTLVQRNSECVRRLRAGDADAAVTDAAILGGFAARYPTELKLNNIASTDDEFWGVGVGIDRTGHDLRVQARRQLVLLALHDLRSSTGQDGWNEAYERNLSSVQEAVSPAPNEYPQLIADDEQPTPEGLEPVRRWPWDRSG